MARRPASQIDDDERPGPAEFTDPVVRQEIRKATVWLGLIALAAGIVILAEPLLLIIGGM